MKTVFKTAARIKSEKLQRQAVRMLKELRAEPGSDWLKLAAIAADLNITQNYAGKLTKAYRDETRATNA